ncbi:TPA: 2Fe-2S iron-sulfur cluster binding domain-containing protein [Pseudomonas aeruginosa]|nr:2Fe-2S iron-sulfur cluster binding domain-containing protein [Pseudomonas aeruginosa]HCA5868830.1 2Fe-2S iron-sulfur cluster binding domain-containing protein [Pseudomonas aeruginosa]HCA7379607.1 2Fe-2S iron-sulfur cluster binding domain-containing protein [Pseudomonas aeruginosa]HCA7777468.1 2Fe-2S iron-sulfur cluster binding domain-containing protein [Pseudomonas aeruginosa]
MFGFFKNSPGGQLVIEGSDFQAPIKAGQSILQAATTARIKFPNMCNVGECGTCKCRLVEGSVRLKRDITHHVSLEELEQGYILGCQAIPDGNVLVQVPGLSATDTSTVVTAGTISALRKLTHDILEVSVKLDQAVHYKAGQYARLSVPGEPSLVDVERNYSFASYAASGESAQATFHIRHVPGGQFTDWLFATDRVGTRLDVAAPYGDFHYRPSQRPLLFIAGGSGLAPVQALLEQLKAEGYSGQISLLLGARQQRDIYGSELAAELAQAFPGRFSFHPVLSGVAEDATWTGLRGYVTDHLQQLAPQLGEHDVYMCGPPVMLDGVLAHLEGKVPAERVHYDKFLDQSSLNAAN